MRTPKFSIIIPTWNHLEDCLKPCVDSIVKYTTINDFSKEVIVVANGCTDGTREYIESLGANFHNIKLLWFDEQLGYTKAVNEGLKEARGEYIILLNNDTILLDQYYNDWVNILYKPFEEDENMGITGPMKTFSPSANRDFLIFFCVMFPRKFIHNSNIGFLDEAFSPGYGEDTDFCCKVEQAGFKIKQVPIDSNEYYADKRMVGAFPIYHAGNKSFVNWPGGEKLIHDNNETLRTRWAHIPTPVYKPTVDIRRAKQCDGFMSDEELTWLATQAKKSKVFFELGSWHGKSSRAIADHLPEDGRLYCIDTWKGSATEQETHHASAKWKDGDHAFIEFSENLFDHIQNGKVIPLRMTGDNAAELLKKQGLKADIVFIDAGHTKDEVKNDITNWKPLVKEGGILCGHDYIESDWLQVKPAVDELFGTDFHTAEKTMIWWKTIEEPSAIFDCFIFNNELDILEARLQELFPVVDRFVIVEATKTHGGKDKPLNFNDNLGRFQRFLHKVTYIVVEDYPQVPENATVTDKSWAIERHQRDAIMRGLTSCKDKDIIIIADCDEIPTADAIQNYRIEQGLMAFEMDLYYYNMHTKSKDKWNEAKILPYSLLKTLTPCGARYSKGGLILSAGKHLSYFGGVDSVIKKIEDTAHQEYNTPVFKDRERVEKAIQEGKDVFGREYVQFEMV